MTLPDNPNLEWLRKQAKRRLEELREANPGARLADAQLNLARQYGFWSWRSLKAHVDSLTVEGQLFDAARKGDAGTLAALLGEHPEKLSVVRGRTSCRCCTSPRAAEAWRPWTCCWGVAWT